ncbi:uncharacterized protein LOC131667609 [Phymastichus coffea]|uniref:uncharacterized protein LOC131667609 n=1 Tax=Phymastichus coffea TaxID=108790 RepID=UPI00273BB2A8|nr:uncharacterized protein LOC131667609 [Phymastichus coffea]
MDPKIETSPIKKTARFSKNVQANECVRQFKLRRHFPSTVIELKKNGIGKGHNTTQTAAITNIISALPLSSNMKFISNKELQSSEVQNLQKLKLKTISGKNLGELNMAMASKIQGKIITVPKIIQNSGRLKKWTESNTEQVQGQKPRIKNITQLLTSSPIEEQCNNSGEACFSKTTVQIVNGEKKLSLNAAQSCSKPIIVQTASNDVLKNIVNPNIIFSTQPKQPQLVTMKQIAGFPKVLMVQKGNNQVGIPTAEKIKSFNLVNKSLLNDQAIMKDDELNIVQAQLSNSSMKKRDGSFLDQPITPESKRSCRDMETQECETNQDKNIKISNKSLGEFSELKNFSNKLVNVSTTKKNIMVIVPNDAAKELTMDSNSLNMVGEDAMLSNNSEIIFLEDEDLIESDNYNQNIEHLNKSKTIQEEIESNIDQNTKNSNSENLSDEFSILEKAVLSVQDENLRTKALKALKDCGIKSKKKVVIKRPLPTKIINESAVQTKVFSLLKEGEFLEADEENDNLIKIKLSRKSSKHSMATTGNIHKNENFDNTAEYKMKLDNIVAKFSQNNEVVFNVKNAFAQNSKLQAEKIMKKLLKDFEATKYYDEDGYLGIHKAVVNNNLQDVQKHILILKAVKRNIDICTEDGQTSLELAVELEVDPQIAKILLDSGAQPISSKAVHDSALILAAKKSSRLLPLLLKYVDRNHKLLNAKNSEGFAAIHYCAQSGYLEGVTELIKHGADVNVQDERSGRTALFYAVDTKSTEVLREVYNEIAQKLVDNGAFSNIPTYSKHSVLSIIDDVKSHSLKIALNRAIR